MVPKSIKIGPQSSLGGVLGHLGPKMAPRWPQDGPKSPQNLENRFLGPPLGSHFGAPNRLKSVPRAIRKVIDFMIGLKIDFGAIWCQLGPILAPQTFPKWSQVGSKTDASWSVDLRVVFARMLA